MKNNVTILVNSCDAYDDAWVPFFELFKKYWPNCEYPVVLNTESKDYVDEALNVKTFNLYKSTDNVPYGERFIEHLKRIDSKYIITLMDDFFIRDFVDTEKIKRYISVMENDKDIAYIAFASKPDKYNIDDNKVEDCILRPRYGEYKINLQSGLWRKDKLMKCIKAHESPWEFETKGSIRTFETKDKFYAVKEDDLSPINYGKKAGLTWGIVRGKWVKDDVDPFFKANNIEIDYSKRGVFDPDNFVDITKNKQTSVKRDIKSYGLWLYTKMIVWHIIRNIRRALKMSYSQDWVYYKRKNYDK